MSNHRQATDPGPSIVSILTLAVFSAASTGGAAWLIWVATDNGHLIGALMGFGLATALMLQAVGRASERALALERRERRRNRFQAEAAARVRQRHGEVVPVYASGGIVAEPEDDRYPQDRPEGPDQTQPLPLPASRVARSLVAVPVFRNEQERAAWRRELDAATETFPRVLDGTDDRPYPHHGDPWATS